MRKDQGKLNLLPIICLAWNLAKRTIQWSFKKISSQPLFPIFSCPSFSLYPVMGLLIGGHEPRSMLHLHAKVRPLQPWRRDGERYPLPDAFFEQVLQKLSGVSST